jgi:hypothetical protein
MEELEREVGFSPIRGPSSWILVLKVVSCHLWSSTIFLYVSIV